MKPFVITQSITNREAIKAYLKDASKIPLLSAEEEKEIAKKAFAGDLKARNTLVVSNLRFVISVAKQYQNRGVNFEDLINEGNSGLIRAAELFDPNKGVRFLSYAIWWIRQSIIAAIYNNGKTIRLPVNQIRDTIQVNKVIKQFEQLNERTPTLSELNELTGLSELKISQLLEYNSNKPLSVDTQFSDEEDSGTLLDILPNPNVKNVDENLLKESESTSIAGILKLLSNREHDLLRLFYGIGVQKLPTKDIAVLFGITTERVRQLKDKAIKKLRTLFKKDVQRILYGEY